MGEFGPVVEPNTLHDEISATHTVLNGDPVFTAGKFEDQVTANCPDPKVRGVDAWAKLDNVARGIVAPPVLRDDVLTEPGLEAVRVVLVVALKEVVARAADDRVGAGLCDDGVIATTPIDQIGIIPGFNALVFGRRRMGQRQKLGMGEGSIVVETHGFDPLIVVVDRSLDDKAVFAAHEGEDEVGRGGLDPHVIGTEPGAKQNEVATGGERPASFGQDVLTKSGVKPVGVVLVATDQQIIPRAAGDIVGPVLAQNGVIAAARIDAVGVVTALIGLIVVVGLIGQCHEVGMAEGAPILEEDGFHPEIIVEQGILDGDLVFGSRDPEDQVVPADFRTDILRRDPRPELDPIRGIAVGPPVVRDDILSEALFEEIDIVFVIADQEVVAGPANDRIDAFPGADRVVAATSIKRFLVVAADQRFVGIRGLIGKCQKFRVGQFGPIREAHNLDPVARRGQGIPERHTVVGVLERQDQVGARRRDAQVCRVESGLEFNDVRGRP